MASGVALSLDTGPFPQRFCRPWVRGWCWAWGGRFFFHLKGVFSFSLQPSVTNIWCVTASCPQGRPRIFCLVICLEHSCFCGALPSFQRRHLGPQVVDHSVPEFPQPSSTSVNSRRAFLTYLAVGSAINLFLPPIWNNLTFRSFRFHLFCFVSMGQAWTRWDLLARLLIRSLRLRLSANVQKYLLGQLPWQQHSTLDLDTGYVSGSISPMQISKVS